MKFNNSGDILKIDDGSEELKVTVIFWTYCADEMPEYTIGGLRKLFASVSYLDGNGEYAQFVWWDEGQRKFISDNGGKDLTDLVYAWAKWPNPAPILENREEL